MNTHTRRVFLKQAGKGLLGTSAAFAGLAATPAVAFSGDYRALICIFLKGGLDHADTLLPYDEPGYALLRQARPSLMASYGVSGSRSRSALLPLNPSNQSRFGSRRFALPPQLAGLKDLFEAGDLAIVGNVGPLLAPTDRNSFEAESVALPARLFSHNDQQSTWQALDVEGAQLGWGGRFVDAAVRGNPALNPKYAAITTGELDVFLASQSTRQFSAAAGGSQRDLNMVAIDYLLESEPRRAALREAIVAFYQRSEFGHRAFMKRDYAQISAQGIRNVRDYIAATVDQNLEFPQTTLGAQLKTIANAMAANQALGTPRQVFYATLGGFDTHSAQSSQLPILQQELADALVAFQRALQALGLWQNTTVFTGSDFGRTVIDNGDGTDHGWGGHHFVAGGAVRGRRIYGSVPSADLGSASYTSRSGRLIPSVAIEQYAGTLGRWFGLTPQDLDGALPNRRRFGPTDLGFLS
ncbi:MAG: DUF1501 domain-containing protein [Pseudomonadota bacterium]